MQKDLALSQRSPRSRSHATLVQHNGFYYYVATTWSSQVVMRKSATIAGLKTAPEQVVVETGGDTMWAPHLELIDGRWYLYYSVEQCCAARRTHVAQSAGSDPMGPYTKLGILDLMPNQGWAIDAAPLRLNGNLYMTFSAFAGDGLQSLYIAPMANPWTASAHGTRISAPTLSWERQEGAVNEGSFAIQRGGRTFLTYSASHCSGPNYKIGMLEYTGTDPLQMSSWTKYANPIFQRNDAAGVYGPAHHSFFTSPDGTETWIAYHANDSASDGCGTTRTTRVQKISWNADGTPNLGVPVATTTVLQGPSGEPNVPPAAIIYMHALDESTGKFSSTDTRLRRLATNVEGTSIVQNGGYFYLMAPTGSCCIGTDSTYHTVVGRATSVTGPYYDQSGRNLVDGGSSTVLMRGPWPHVAAGGGDVYTDGDERYFAYHYYDADNYGRGTLDIRRLTFANGWPIFDAPLGRTDAVLQVRHSNLCADVWSQSTEPAAAVNQGTCNGGDNQLWQVTRDGDVYQFQATHSGQCLEIYGASTTQGATANQWPCNRGDNQLWLMG